MYEEKYKWLDPNPEAKGVLLSDQIKFYAEKINLIEPFDEKNLRPASYTMHIGDEFYFNDRQIYPNNKGEIEIPSNGLIYFKLYEKLNMPYYMTARHNLTVRQQYRAIIAGVSLHVDPGYVGYINYFVYNFTNDKRILKVGDEIATIEFVKTTQFGNQDFWKDNNKISAADLEKSKVNGFQSYECVKYPIKERQGRQIHNYWIGGETHLSSLWELKESFSSLKTEYKQLKEDLCNEIKLAKEAFDRKVDTAKNIVSLTILFGSVALILWIASQIIGMQGKISESTVAIKQLENKLNEKERVSVGLDEKKDATIELEANNVTMPSINPQQTDISKVPNNEESISSEKDTLQK